MYNLTVKDILQATNGTLLSGKLNTECESFSKDTRMINSGDIYIGIKGEKFDGNTFWKNALDKGALGVIVENQYVSNHEIEKYKDKIIIIVDNTLTALYDIARIKREHYNIPIIAVTGSVGKTSTKDIIASVLSKKFKTLKTIGNNNNNIGLPFTLLRLKDEEVAVIEMGMNHSGEISLLSNIAKPNICIITNIGTSHIGNLGSRENILKAKLEIIDGSKDPLIIINSDNDLLHDWYINNINNYNILTFGIQNKSNFTANNIVLDDTGSTFNCTLNNSNIQLNVPIAGEHFILNSLCAACVGEHLGMTNEQIKNGIESLKLTENRMDIFKLPNGITIINDAYNSSYESVKATLNVMQKYKKNRKIAVLGDMLELGNFSKELHEKVGEEISKNNIDILICYGKYSEFIANKAKTNLNQNNIYLFDKKEKIKELLIKIAKDGDVILFKASNGMKLFQLADNLVNYWNKE